MEVEGIKWNRARANRKAVNEFDILALEMAEWLMNLQNESYSYNTFNETLEYRRLKRLI